MELTGNVTGYLTNDGSGNWNFSTNGLIYTFGQSSGKFGISTAVPEPSTDVLLVLGALVLVIACRRMRWC